MKHAVLAAGFAAVAAVAAASPAAGQQPTYKRNIPDALAKQATITEDSAVAIAKRRVPKGDIRSLELESEKGSLIYSFDMKVPGRSGVEEVNVSARSGKVLAVEHESAAAEKREAAAEASGKKPSSTKKP